MIFLTYKQNVDGRTIIIEDNDKRANYNFRYLNLDQLLTSLDREVNMLSDYHTKDFPIGTKSIFITLKNPIRTQQALAGYTLEVGKYRSNQTDKDGICESDVQRQGNAKVSLLFFPKDNDAEIFQRIEIKQLYEQDIQNYDEIEIEIPKKFFTNVRFNLKTKLKKSVNVKILQKDLAKIQDVDSFSLKNQSQIIPLLPSRYFCNVSSENDEYLNIWFKPLHIFNEKINERVVPFEIKKDSFFIRKDAFAIINGELDIIKQSPKNNDLTGPFKDYILGSRYFLLRLFQHLDENKDKREEVKLLWNRLRSFLFDDDSKYSNSRDAFLYHSYLKIGLIEKKPAKDHVKSTKPHGKSRVYLKLMMDKYIDGESELENKLSDDDRDYYLAQFIRGFLGKNKLYYIMKIFNIKNK